MDQSSCCQSVRGCEQANGESSRWSYQPSESLSKTNQRGRTGINRNHTAYNYRATNQKLRQAIVGTEAKHRVRCGEVSADVWLYFTVAVDELFMPPDIFANRPTRRWRMVWSSCWRTMIGNSFFPDVSFFSSCFGAKTRRKKHTKLESASACTTANYKCPAWTRSNSSWN